MKTITVESNDHNIPSCGSNTIDGLQISCAPFSPAFTGKSRLSNFFQMLPSDIDNAQIFSDVIFHYHWRKVALIVQNEIQFTAVRFTMKSLKQLSSMEFNNYRTVISIMYTTTL